MKRCPTCNRTYSDASLNFCLEDGSQLQSDVPRPPDPNATIRYPGARDTAEPPPTEIYRPDSPHITASPTAPAQQWSPMPPGHVQQKSSNALWWVLGGLGLVAVLGIGAIVVLIALANIGANTNNENSNVRIANTNTDTNTNESTNANSGRNANTNTLPASISDDFSVANWGSGRFQFGEVWYTDGEYHMRSKERTFIVMYAPSDGYATKDATVKVTARSVDGTVPSNGFGLMVHCAQSKTKQLEDYAFLIYPEPEPEFEVVMHKDGIQSTLVNRTKSSAIRSGSTPNQLEVRVKGDDLEFYVNGEYLTSITDKQNYKGGRAGLYTSDAVEVAFDDLKIQRQKPQ
jgi:hypothetical protein